MSKLIIVCSKDADFYRSSNYTAAYTHNLSYVYETRIIINQIFFIQKPQTEQSVGASHSRSHERAGSHFRGFRIGWPQAGRFDQAGRWFGDVWHQRKLKQNDEDQHEGYRQERRVGSGHQLQILGQEQDFFKVWGDSSRQQDEQERLRDRKDSAASDGAGRSGRPAPKQSSMTWRRGRFQSDRPSNLVFASLYRIYPISIFHSSVVCYKNIYFILLDMYIYISHTVYNLIKMKLILNNICNMYLLRQIYFVLNVL